jgi:hypothetical protein
VLGASACSLIAVVLMADALAAASFVRLSVVINTLWLIGLQRLSLPCVVAGLSRG